MILRQHLQQALSRPASFESLERNFFAQHPDVWWQNFCIRHNQLCENSYFLDAKLAGHLRELVPQLKASLSEHKKLHHRINQGIAVTAFDLHRSAGPIVPIHVLYAICAQSSTGIQDTTIQKQIIRPWFDLLDRVKACPYYNGVSPWPAYTFVPFARGIIDQYRHQTHPVLQALAIGALDQMGKGYPPETVFEIDTNQLLGKTSFPTLKPQEPFSSY